jgi:hypothetical protein
MFNPEGTTNTKKFQESLSQKQDKSHLYIEGSEAIKTAIPKITGRIFILLPSV